MTAPEIWLWNCIALDLEYLRKVRALGRLRRRIRSYSAALGHRIGEA